MKHLKLKSIVLGIGFLFIFLQAMCYSETLEIFSRATLRIYLQTQKKITFSIEGGRFEVRECKHTSHGDDCSMVEYIINTMHNKLINLTELPTTELDKESKAGLPLDSKKETKSSISLYFYENGKSIQKGSFKLDFKGSTDTGDINVGGYNMHYIFQTVVRPNEPVHLMLFLTYN